MPTIPEQLTALQTQINTLTASLGTLSKRVDDLAVKSGPDLAPLAKRLDGAEKVSGDALSSSKDALAATKTFNTLVAEVKTELARIAGDTSKVSGLNATVAALTAKVSAPATNDNSALYTALNEVRAALGLEPAGVSDPATTAPSVPVTAPETAKATPSADRTAALSDNIRHLLDTAGLDTDSKVAATSDAVLLAIKGIGAESLNVIRKAVPAAQTGEKEGN